jgi:hypothetical protein
MTQHTTKQIQEAIYRQDIATLADIAPRHCRGVEATHWSCPARMWGGCRAQLERLRFPTNGVRPWDLP